MKKQRQFCTELGGTMNKEAVIVMLDCNSSMGRLFASKGVNGGPSAQKNGDADMGGDHH